MAQFARPNSTIRDVLWTPIGQATLWECLDEYIYTDFIQGAHTNGYCTVGLSTVTDPVVHTGHVLRCNCYGAAGSGHRVKVELTQGGVVLAIILEVYPLPGTSTTYERELTEEEAALLTDYSDLELNIWLATATGGDIAYVYWVELEVPGIPPTVTTQAVTDIAKSTATGNYNITSIGGKPVTEHGVCWNTTGTPTTADDKTEEGAGSVGAFTSSITELLPGTKYYLRAYAINAEGTAYGEEVEFTTKPDAPSNLACVVQSSSQIDVSWTKGAGATKTMVRRKVGSYPSDVIDGDQAYYGTGNSFNDTGLDPGEHYYYRAWSWVEGSDIWSDDYAEDNAWTLIGTPTVTTDPATALSAIAATPNGTLNQDGGEACECGFEWGLDTGYGTTTPPQSKTTGEPFSQVIGGLVPGTTYHFRAFATNSAGTSHGADRSFATALVISRGFALAREEL